MKKLKLQMQISADGFVCGPEGQMDWMVFNWDDGLKNYVAKLTDSTETILLGANLAKGFIPHWAAAAANSDDPEVRFAKEMHERPRVVFSKTISRHDWPNARITAGDPAAEIQRLKLAPGKDLITYGGASFAAYLTAAGLVDEFHLFMNPAAIGKGMSIFSALTENMPLTRISAEAFACGITAFHFVPAKPSAR